MTNATSEVLSLELSNDVQELLGKLAGLIREPREPLEASVAGRDILHFTNSAAGIEMACELSLFADTLGPRRYGERVFVFERNNRGGKARWAAHQAEYAAPLVMGSDSDNLLEFIEALQGSAESQPTVASWAHGFSVDGRDAFVVLLRHSEGLLAQFLVRGGEWVLAPLSDVAIRAMLGPMLRQSQTEEGFWSHALAVMTKAASKQEGRDAARAVLAEVGFEGELSEEAWLGLVQAVLVNKPFLRNLQETARSAASRPMREAQRLLEALAQLSAHASQAIDEQAAQAKKEHARAYKRLQGSHERLNMQFEGIKARASRVSAENAALRKQLASTSKHRDGPKTEATEPSERLTAALNAYFDA